MVSFEMILAHDYKLSTKYYL